MAQFASDVRAGECVRKDCRAGALTGAYTEAARERLLQRSKDWDGRALLRRRRMRAEHPFGHIKHNLGMRSFLLRGLIGVSAEAALAATSFNLARMLTLVGVRKLIQNLTATPTSA
jgi:IS5 family transposase